MVMAEKEKGRPSRFRLPKSAAEEEVLANVFTLVPGVE